MIVKICGINTLDTLKCCNQNNIDFFGMIFYKKSPRNISVRKAKILQKESKNLNINGVGVFVNENLNNINQYIENLNLNYIQLHGAENEDYIKKIKNLNIKVIKKISIKKKSDLDSIKYFKSADYYLFDYKPENNELPGGNAKSFDWNIVKDLKIDKPWFLSGGVNIDNIELIKSKIVPFGVDLSSGVEKKLGIKDNRIINNFIEKLNNA